MTFADIGASLVGRTPKALIPKSGIENSADFEFEIPNSKYPKSKIENPKSKNHFSGSSL